MTRKPGLSRNQNLILAGMALVLFGLAFAVMQASKP